MLRVTDFGASVDDFLSGFKEFLGKLSELKDFSFDKRVAQSSYGTVDELLVRLSVLEYALTERGEQRLGAVAGSCSQLNCEDGMPFSHGGQGPRVHVVHHELDIFGFAAVVVGISYGCCDTEPPIGLVLHEGRSGMGVSRRVVDYFLVSASHCDRGCG